MKHLRYAPLLHNRIPSTHTGEDAQLARHAMFMMMQEFKLLARPRRRTMRAEQLEVQQERLPERSGT